MFEENKNNIEEIDLVFKSALEDAQEPVPAHIWQNVEADLDSIAAKRLIPLWLKRSGFAVAAAAALALGLFFGHGGNEDLVNPAADNNMIALVEEDEAKIEETEIVPNGSKEASQFIAMANKPAAPGPKTETNEIKVADNQESENADDAEVATEKPVNKAVTTKKSDEKEVSKYESFPEVWPEEESKKNKIGTSLVISGLSSTNGEQNSARINPMKRPALSSAPKKTGIKETSTNSTYGVPFSAGLGVKLDINPRWSVGLGVNYSLLSRKFYGTYTNVGQDGSILKDVSSDIKNVQHYIGIPVNAYYNIVNQDKIKFYTYAGGTIEKCVSDKYQILNTNITHSETSKGVQLSADFGLGVEFMMGQHLGLYVDPSLRYYFKSEQPKSIRTVQPLMLGFELGFRFRL